MTAGTENQDQRTDEQVQSVDRIRRELAEGFAAVRAKETTIGISAMSLAEIIARDIRQITEEQSDIRPSKLGEVERIRQRVIAAVDQALALPGSAFEITEENAAANTDEDGEGPNSLETEDG